MVRTEPDTFARLEEAFRGPVVFHFDERISERLGSGTLDDAVILSPRTGNVRVSAGRDKIEVSVGGGFRPGLVYRVRLLPEIRDLFGNQIRDAIEIVFSTGGEFVESAIAGVAWDRATGLGIEGLDVTATAEDSTVYYSRSDSSGIYAFRYLPLGRYRIEAYEDRNRNDQVDRMETQGARAALLSVVDTLLLDVPVLAPDTTPARMTGVEVLDSVTLAVAFDDFLDPSIPVVGIELTRGEEAEPGPAPRIVRVFHESEYGTWVQQVTDSLARVDSIARAQAPPPPPAPDSTQRPDSMATDSAADTVLPPAGPARPRPPALPAAAGAGGARGGGASRPVSTPDGSPLPGRRLVVVLDTALTPNIGYQINATSVTNLNGIPGGGGDAAVVRRPPQPDSAAVSDSAAVGDTVPPPDTGTVVRGADRTTPGSRTLPFLPGRRR